MFVIQTLCKVVLASGREMWNHFDQPTLETSLGLKPAHVGLKGKFMTAPGSFTDAHWAEHPDYALPEGLLATGEGETVSDELTGLSVRMSARVYPDGPEAHFHVRLGESLRDVFEGAAHALQKPLLPPAPATPLDYLHLRRHNGSWGPPVEDFSVPLWKVLAEGFSRHVGVEYRLVVRINTKWGVALAPQITPRSLLTEFGFDPSQFSLYKPHSNVPLPPDTPMTLERGEHFEAQKDGRYGGVISSVPARGFQSLEDDVARLRAESGDVILHRIGTQRYVECCIRIPSPLWSATRAKILIAVPDNYPQGGLDAFYLESGITQGGTVPRQQSTVSFLSRNWSLISWHYATSKPWDPRYDDLGSHVEHCRGFFQARGVTQ